MSEDATAASKRNWEGASAGWKRYRARVFESVRPISERLIETLDARDGQTILELAAGPGETGLLLAERVPGARVILSDFAPGMVAAAREGAEERGLANVSSREIDMQSIDLPDASVDGVMCRYGMMFPPDRAAAFREIRRVLKRGGTFAYATWGPIDANPWMGTFARAFVAHGLLPAPPPGQEGMPLGRESEHEEVLADTGFDDVAIELVDHRMAYESVDDYWEMSRSLAGPLSGIEAGLTAEQRAALKATVHAAVESFADASGRLEFPSRTIVVRAR